MMLINDIKQCIEGKTYYVFKINTWTLCYGFTVVKLGSRNMDLKVYGSDNIVTYRNDYASKYIFPDKVNDICVSIDDSFSLLSKHEPEEAFILKMRGASDIEVITRLLSFLKYNIQYIKLYNID